MMHEPREPRRRLEGAKLRSRDGDSCVVAFSDGRGGEALLQLDPPYSSPQFLPDVGGDVVLDMSGPVPQVVARQIAVDAISAREARFDLMTALLVMGAKIVAGDPEAGRIELDSDSLRLYRPDGTVTIRLDTATGNALVTGEYRSAESGERFVINPDGVNPGEIRFHAAVGTKYGAIEAVSNFETPELLMTGPVEFGQFTPSLKLGALGYELMCRNGTQQSPTGKGHGVYADSNSVELKAYDNNETPTVSNRVEVNTGGIVLYARNGYYPYVGIDTPELLVTGAAGTRFKTDTIGVGFNGAAPIARRTVNAAATTAAETTALVNQLRALLVDVGLAQ